MANYITTDTELTSVANAIRAKGGTSESLTYPAGFVTAIQNIPSGGGGGGGSDVIFYDYDGTVISSYSASEFASLAALPANPSHEGLIAQGWNWSLANAKTHVAKYGKLNIGQMYVTQSGATEIDVEMQEGRLEPILGICVDGTITVDWGDGTTPDTVTGTSRVTEQTVQHAYESEGSYTISILGTGNNFYKFGNNDAYPILRKKNESSLENYIYSGTVKHVRIGNNVDFNNYTFANCHLLLSITIPSNVSEFGASLFNNCYSLLSVTIPDGVTTINTGIFGSCYSLLNVIIPNSVTSIGGSAFNECYALSSVSIPDGVNRINSSLFNSCSSLLNVNIPDGVTRIDGNAFCNCYSLKDVAIPDGLTNLGASAFSGCRSLSKIILPNSAINFNGSMLYGCRSLSNIVIPYGATTIPTSSFSSCASLSSITLPSSITSIGSQAFASCYSLSSITLSNSITSIGSNAFQNCYALSSITIPSNVNNIGSSAFTSCYGLKEIHVLPTTPPTAGSTMFSNIVSDCIIYVPKGHLNDYQTATNWSTYASYMQEEPD